MLGHLISKAPQLIRPYIQPILAVLIPKLKESDQNLGVVISILTAVGDIALVCHIFLYLAYFLKFCLGFKCLKLDIHVVIIVRYVQGGPAKVRPTYIFDSNI